MAWECISCHRSIPHDHDTYDHGQKPICWDCLYEQREALLEACEAASRAMANEIGMESEHRQCVAAITASKGQFMKGFN